MDWLKQRTRTTPNNLALIIAEQSWTYAELDQQTDQLCQRLISSGVVPGQLVAMLMAAGVEFVCLVHGLARLGATLLPLNGRLTLPELSWQLDHTQAAWLIYDEAEAARAAGLVAASPGPLSLIGLERLTVSAERLAVNFESSFDRSAVQAIVFTSGTTGQPKGVMLTFENHFWSANASAYRLGLDPNDRWISCLPLYHVGGLAVLFRSCLYGTAVILHQRFDIEAINHTLEAQQGSLISVVPTMLYRLLETRRFLA